MRHIANLLIWIISLVALASFAVVSRGDQRDIWTDQDTNLMWTAADSGSGLSGLQASCFCKSNATGGYDDWHLPSIDQLQTLVTPIPNEAGYHVRGPLHLSGWEWSSTPGEAKGERWSLDFGDGARASVLTGDSGLNRALCVRQH